jgi:hypothetical protein
MPDLIPPYPLQWPDGTPRTRTRQKSQFRTGLPAAIKNVTTSLRLFGDDSGIALSAVQVTSNVGLMHAAPADPGVAVWFQWDGALRCIAVDRYLTVAENLQAIHHVLEARRVEMRHAGITMTRAAFRGFVAALPAPGERPWSEVLGVPTDATPDQIAAAYKARARDLATRGDEGQRCELNVARDKALKERAA